MTNPLGERWYPLRPHPTQDKLYVDPVRFPVVPAGRRSGKTERAKRYVSKTAITEKTNFKENFYFCGAPTRSQAKRIYWDDIKELTRAFWCNKPNETDLTVYTKFDGIKSQISVLGLDEPARVEGSPWNGGIIDEMRKIKAHAWGQHIRPALSDREGWCWRCGVPEGRNHYYEIAVIASGGVPITIPKTGVFAQGNDPEMAYYSWHSADILPEREIISAKRDLDDKLFRQEYEGSFESFEGLVYYAYTPDYYPNGNLDESVKYNSDLPIFLMMDFNVSPMTALCGHVLTATDCENVGLQELHLFRGYHLQASNTENTIKRIIADHPNTNRYIIVTCHSGQNRQTVAQIGVTDRKIIKNEMVRHNKYCEMRHRSRNPPIMQRIHALNCMLSANRIKLNSKDNGIKELMRDFEGLVYKEGSSEVDKSDPMREHISSALGYGVERFWPVATENVDVDLPFIL